jgi:predicted acyltransferase
VSRVARSDEPRSAGAPIALESVRPSSARLVSLDAYRGATMMLLVTGPLFAGIAQRFDANIVFRAIAHQLAHADGAGCRLWDLIMPSFMLMVGVSMPYSYASRSSRGESPWQIRRHVLQRSVVFVLLGLLLSSRYKSETQFVFNGLLTTFGLAYSFAFALVGRGLRVQSAAIAAILVADWLAFVLYPAAPPGFDFHAFGMPDGVAPFTGLFAHWNLGANLAADFDRWFLNLFPRSEPYQFDLGNLQTLNFIPAIATMAIGVAAGEMLRRPLAHRAKLVRLARSGAALLAGGTVASLTVCPLMKQLWTPSWVLFSGGMTLLTLAGFFWAIEMRGWSRPAFPFVVVGMNSIAMYLLYELTQPWVEHQLEIHHVRSWVAQVGIANAILWLVCFWMYRRRLFVRI